MEEKKGLSIFLIIIIIILIIVISSATTIIIYRNILKSNGETHLVDTINEDLNSIKNSENMNNTAKLNIPSTINNKNINLEIESSFVV